MSAAAQPNFTPEFATTYKTMLLGRIANEQKTTRKVIAAIPSAKSGYKPDPKSRSALELAHHLATSEIWFLNSIAAGKFEWSDPPAATSIEAVLAAYDRDFPAAWERANKTSPDGLMAQADFFGIMKMPNFMFIQFCQDHTVHHRGQLAAYLRPMGGKVPDIYGGSADEPFKGQ